MPLTKKYCVLAVIAMCFVLMLLVAPEFNSYDNYLEKLFGSSYSGYSRGGAFLQYLHFSCKNKPFNGIVLVITFNFPHYKNIPLLAKFYENVFERVIYCGPKPTDAKDGVPTLEVPINNGYFGYECMREAISRFPSYKGYLYVNDDMIINWWNLLQFDRNKVWQGAEIVDFTQEASGDIRNKQWIWWASEMGQSACNKAYLELKAIAEKGTNDFNAKRSLEIYLENGGGKPRCGKGWSDFFYIPGHLAHTAKHILSIYRSHSLFLEISVTNLLRTLDLEKNFEEVKGIYLPDLGITDSTDGKAFWTKYDTKITFIHPFKLNFEVFRDMNIAIFKNWVIDLGQRFSNCTARM